MLVVQYTIAFIKPIIAQSKMGNKYLKKIHNHEFIVFCVQTAFG